MYPQTHFLMALFLGEILVKLDLLNQKAVIVCAVLAVLIDLDHWVAFIVHHRQFNFRKAWNIAALSHKETERTFIQYPIHR